jgi:hypothetical protein
MVGKTRTACGLLARVQGPPRMGASPKVAKGCAARVSTLPAGSTGASWPPGIPSRPVSSAQAGQPDQGSTGCPGQSVPSRSREYPPRTRHRSRSSWSARPSSVRPYAPRPRPGHDPHRREVSEEAPQGVRVGGSPAGEVVHPRGAGRYVDRRGGAWRPLGWPMGVTRSPMAPTSIGAMPSATFRMLAPGPDRRFDLGAALLKGRPETCGQACVFFEHSTA